MAKILVVDNAVPVRVLIKVILANGGHEVIGEASSGREAVEKYRQLKPDLVTMDINMPVMDGVKAALQIKLEDSEAKIVMCSTMGHLVVQAMQAGATDFIVKPFDIDRFLDAVNRVLAG
ncbi:response regulator [Paenibacillus prosopidis]|uniref:Two-component system chemotaxis response regulator CheY n=1 Tax=Paenibacillus prosopidis TaxID=630520 RepID=A0A368VPY9_9BACL|nr:response regulator [Paenibacillus prosopidis]RCW43085.1 two-component system chemotaxis response regulator CheY [Paenibacillus prosopidis]